MKLFKSRGNANAKYQGINIFMPVVAFFKQAVMLTSSHFLSLRHLVSFGTKAENFLLPAIFAKNFWHTFLTLPPCKMAIFWKVLSHFTTRLQGASNCARSSFFFPHVMTGCTIKNKTNIPILFFIMQPRS